MSFCWFTGFIGYPNFFKKSGNSYDLAHSFLTLAKAALQGKSYSEAKLLFPNLDHAQVETKKAAFQEFGLIYVVPRSNRLSLTPLGQQIFELCQNPEDLAKNRRTILLSLCNALSRYQFNNPLPVGGNKGLSRAQSSDVLPYLATYYLLLKLDGYLTINELRGAIFGLQSMNHLYTLEKDIKDHRIQKKPFPDLASLPANKGTADNLKIYFMAHLSLDGEIITPFQALTYGLQEQAFALTQLGYEITSTVVSSNWPTWKRQNSVLPYAVTYSSIEQYFENGVGRSISNTFIKKDISATQKRDYILTGGILDTADLDSLKEMRKKEFEEGRIKLVLHARIEKIRNPQLIKQAKRLFKRQHGRLFCELCDFDFEIKYGKRGKNYIEAHHKKPISESDSIRVVTVDDLCMVCSNCHSMLHRPPWISVDELIENIKK